VSLDYMRKVKSVDGVVKRTVCRLRTAAGTPTLHRKKAGTFLLAHRAGGRGAAPGETPVKLYRVACVRFCSFESRYLILSQSGGTVL
jgi:hypothetical protein